jgi:hypothetical protein
MLVQAVTLLISEVWPVRISAGAPIAMIEVLRGSPQSPPPPRQMPGSIASFHSLVQFVQVSDANVDSPAMPSVSCESERI